MSDRRKLFLWGLALGAVFALAGLPGCTTQPKTDPAPAAPIGEQADAARATERTTIQARDSAQMASLDALLAHVPNMTQEGWESELGIMRARYPKEAKPTPADASAANARVTAWASGEAEAARSLAAQALAAATQHAQAAAIASKARLDAEAKEAISRQASADALKAKDAEIARLQQEAKDKVAQAVQFWFALGLRIAGVALWLAAGARLYAAFQSPLGARGVIKSTGILFVLGSAAFSLSWAVAQSWFWWATGGVAALGIGLFVWLSYRREKDEHHLKASDDVISGVEDVKALFEKPTAEMAEIVRNADTHEKAAEAVRKLGEFMRSTMREWVTDDDGTAEVIRARRRALKLPR